MNRAEYQGGRGTSGQCNFICKRFNRGRMLGGKSLTANGCDMAAFITLVYKGMDYNWKMGS